MFGYGRKNIKKYKKIYFTLDKYCYQTYIFFKKLLYIYTYFSLYLELKLIII
jgi:hypothetical protein